MEFNNLNFFLIFISRQDTKSDDKPITSILHEEEVLDYDEFEEEKSEGI